MKKITFSLLAVFLLLTSYERTNAQQNEPVYFAYGGYGPYIVEFAINGPRKDLIKELEPFIQNGRIYFYEIAIPISTGNLRPGFEFNLDYEDEYLVNPRIKAIYRGQARDTLPDDWGAYPVAGYAERGAIVITHVFYSGDEEEAWLSTIRYFE